MKKLVVCFDGTWNRSGRGDLATNVEKLYRSILGEDRAGLDAQTARPDPKVRTIKWYDEGVGTESGKKFSGGITGLGLSLNIRQGFKFLIDAYEPGDEIYVFGFSRGAYSARSLVGLIRNVGLIKREHAPQPLADDNAVITDGYELYKKRDEGADTDEAKQFRDRFSQSPVAIKFVGVWDTVGALGIPLSIFKKLNDDRWGFHDTRLSGRVENAYQALAVDEHRREFGATLWNPRETFPNSLEQRWFIGAHSDVGGGSRKPQFSDISLRWMQERAQLGGAGLEIDAAMVPAIGDAHLNTSISDSFGDMLGGVYAFFMKLFRGGRYRRTVRGTLFGNEVVDGTVERKREVDGRYAPKNRGL